MGSNDKWLLLKALEFGKYSLSLWYKLMTLLVF